MAHVFDRAQDPPSAGFATERLRLRPFAEKDLESFAAYRRDPEVARFQSWDAEAYTLEKAKQLFETSCQEFNVPGTWYQMAVADAETDELVGDCAIHFLEDGQQVEIGYTLAREHQGKGFAREAVDSLVHFLFFVLKKRRIAATTDVLNARSVTG
ncbi:p20 [Symbiodinium natans]|uniref:p20 protein n=1 Tax=Symbiodinium natans TaxID=878477 RepID=A0A812JYH5_9DINO|nr:p20 [Symbiodinium natans]